jgi:tetratricopeptide (TPR) repeat protein
MLELPSVTLCCIDTANPLLALRALRISAAGIRFARVLMLTDRPLESQGIDAQTIAPLTSRTEYSEFVLKSLLGHIDTEHVLLIQWDGYVINPSAWKDEFLGCDYIGAKWFWHEDSHRVGNGGFSLRSRKLLRALQDPRVELDGPEDETICRRFRPLLEREHDIVFASEKLADDFAFEAAYPIGKPFGFHGLYNFCRVVPPQELAELTRLFTPAIARSPQLLQLGRNCLALGMWGPAAAIFRRILDEVPDSAEAQRSLATAAGNEAGAPLAGRNDPCPCGSGKRFKHCHGAALASEAPGTASSLMQRLEHAVGLHQRGDADAALPIYREVLAQQPDNPIAQHFLGVIHYQRGNLAEALPLLERATALKYDEPEFHNNLGLALAAADRVDQAAAAYRTALAIKPDHAVAWNNLGLALQANNEVAAAIDAFRRALALNAEFTHARWNLALALLLDCQFDEGWRKYDTRLALPELGKYRNRFPGPRWDGEAMAGKTILLYPEQGLGDALHFARYAAILAARGARCVIRCPDSLAPLLATVPGVSEVVSEGQPLPHYDVHAPLLSLPRLLRTTAASIPASVPYITVQESKREAARAKLVRSSAPWRAGLVWSGNPTHGNDRNRSIALEALLPLFAVKDIGWFSLQHGERAAQIATTPGAKALVPLEPDSTLSDTAALVAELDLIISVDTAIVHLAGALAKPVWILLPFAPDWRWQLDRSDSPWYPTARLFRQPRARDWSAVVSNVVAELRAWASSAS